MAGRRPRWNRYAGWRIRADQPRIGSIGPEISPGDFWRRFVRRRRPVKISGLPGDLAGLLGLSGKQLAEVAGRAAVEVDQRTGGRFGRGRSRRVRLGSLLARLAAGDGQLYMATQPLEADGEGRPEVLAPPLKQLHRAGLLPLRPGLLGRLVPMNINMWLGHSTDGASSGLHHDFHDNLYVLLRGRKRFRLYSPADAHRMRTGGQIVAVHPNGRINYKGCRTAADGAAIGARAAAAAERRLGRAAGGGDEAEMERALEALLEAEQDSGREQDRPNFCRASRVPAPGAECELEAGEMLWLPAGWFHEVSSWSGRGGHMAINYWCHPPDGDRFEAPYRSKFWPRDWREREANGEFELAG